MLGGAPPEPRILRAHERRLVELCGDDATQARLCRAVVVPLRDGERVGARERRTAVHALVVGVVHALEVERAARVLAAVFNRERSHFRTNNMLIC